LRSSTSPLSFKDSTKIKIYKTPKISFVHPNSPKNSAKSKLSKIPLSIFYLLDFPESIKKPQSLKKFSDSKNTKLPKKFPTHTKHFPSSLSSNPKAVLMRKENNNCFYCLPSPNCRQSTATIQPLCKRGPIKAQIGDNLVGVLFWRVCAHFRRQGFMQILWAGIWRRRLCHVGGRGNYELDD
jgi:hypothetical protein